MATLTLNTGAKMPVVGLGCWLGIPGKGENTECYEMVVEGLKQNYKHLDTASKYGNENGVGRAVQESSIPRSEIFVTTKLPGTRHSDVKLGLEESLKALDIGYIDLYLMHWPITWDPETNKPLPYGTSPTFLDAWKSLEELYLSEYNALEDGKPGKFVKAIGVSNFSIKTLEVILKDAKVVPAVNQVEAHLYHPNKSLREYCTEKGIVLTAYSPLGQPGQDKVLSPILEDEVVIRIAKKYSVPTGTIALSWLTQTGYTIVPKSASPSRMATNLKTITLEPEDFETLTQLHTQEGKLRKLCVGQTNSAETKVVQGWSLEELGWEKLD